MSIIKALLLELEQEAETTRRVLERVPGDRLSWKPHAKSMSLGQLALHVATIPGNVAQLASHATIPEPPAFNRMTRIPVTSGSFFALSSPRDCLTCEQPSIRPRV